MNPRHALHPDLAECMLEDRCPLAYSPNIAGFILTTSGYVILSVPPGLSSALNSSSNGPGSSGGAGGNVPSSFNISGFGPSSFTIGNVTGFPSLNAGQATTAGVSGGGGGSGGAGNSSGGGNGGGGGPGTTSNFSGYGGSISSGYNTALNSANNYGMSGTTVGSVPVHTYDNGTVAQAPAQGQGQGQAQRRGQDDPNAGSTTPNPNLWDSLFKKKPGGASPAPMPMPGGPSLFNP